MTTMYRGDLKPDLVITLTDGGSVVDLTAATSIRVIGISAGAVVFDRAPASATALGVVTMPWQTADTATVRRISIEVEVTWSGAKPQTFRPDTAVDIVADYA